MLVDNLNLNCIKNIYLPHDYWADASNKEESKDEP